MAPTAMDLSQQMTLLEMVLSQMDLSQQMVLSEMVLSEMDLSQQMVLSEMVHLERDFPTDGSFGDGSFGEVHSQVIQRWFFGDGSFGEGSFPSYPGDGSLEMVHLRGFIPKLSR